MFFIFVFGTRFITWGAEPAGQATRCGQCGAVGIFKAKKGMRFITFFFVIPVVPLSGVKRLVECPNCRTRYEASPN